MAPKHLDSKFNCWLKSQTQHSLISLLLPATWWKARYKSASAKVKDEESEFLGQDLQQAGCLSVKYCSAPDVTRERGGLWEATG